MSVDRALRDALEVNRTRGDTYRYELWRMTHRVLDALDDLGIYTPNESGYPIIEIPLVNPDDIGQVGRYLFDHGVYVTMAAYPLVPHDEVGFRIQVTAANTDEQVNQLIATLQGLAERFQMRDEPAPTPLRRTS